MFIHCRERIVQTTSFVFIGLCICDKKNIIKKTSLNFISKFQAGQNLSCCTNKCSERPRSSRWGGTDGEETPLLHRP